MQSGSSNASMEGDYYSYTYSDSQEIEISRSSQNNDDQLDDVETQDIEASPDIVAPSQSIHEYLLPTNDFNPRPKKYKYNGVAKQYNPDYYTTYDNIYNEANGKGEILLRCKELIPEQIVKSEQQTTTVNERSSRENYVAYKSCCDQIEECPEKHDNWFCCFIFSLPLGCCIYEWCCKDFHCHRYYSCKDYCCCIGVFWNIIFNVALAICILLIIASTSKN